MTDQTHSRSFAVTERAAKRIAEILAGESDAHVMRVSVDGGGCSGFQYRFDLVAGEEPGDLVVGPPGARVVIDAVSLPFVTGAELDFVDDLIGAQFKVKNPHAKSSCGCGISFSL